MNWSGHGLTSSGLYSFQRDGGYQFVPFGGDASQEGALDLAGHTIGKVLFQDQDLHVLASASDSGTTLLTFDGENPEKPVWSASLGKAFRGDRMLISVARVTSSGSDKPAR